MRIWLGLAAALSVVFTGLSAHATDENSLKNLVAPSPFELRSLPAGLKTKPVKFARVVVQLSPEPWAFLRIDGHTVGSKVVYRVDRLITWDEGQREVTLSTVSGIFNQELRRAGASADQSADSLFEQESTADLQIGVKITEMQGRFCQYCMLLGWAPKWMGSVVMSAHWEVYSSLDRKVIATIDTRGGYNTPKDGIDGDAEMLINEAFRENVRRLIASEDFQHAITASASPQRRDPQEIAASPISIHGPLKAGGIANASNSVAIVYAADGQGSGFLVSADGYVLTNQHVVGGSKYVKLKWSGGAETLGEVVRVDRRRDVALIKTEPQGRAPLALRTGPAQQGETVFAIGTPLDDKLQNTMTKGIVSAERTDRGLRFIQSDAAVTHGNSGGPLLDDKGRVIALTVSGLEPAGSPIGLNFFIPIDDALKALSLTPAS